MLWHEYILSSFTCLVKIFVILWLPSWAWLVNLSAILDDLSQYFADRFTFLNSMLLWTFFLKFCSYQCIKLPHAPHHYLLDDVPVAAAFANLILIYPSIRSLSSKFSVFLSTMKPHTFHAHLMQKLFVHLSMPKLLRTYLAWLHLDCFL